MTLIALPLIIGVENWYQTPAFFVLMVPVIAGFIHALVIALMPDERFDARFNATQSRRNRSGWDAVLVAVATLFVGRRRADDDNRAADSDLLRVRAKGALLSQTDRVAESPAAAR